MSPFNVVNGLVVCSISTIVKQLESKDCVFAPHEQKSRTPLIVDRSKNSQKLKTERLPLKFRPDL